MRLVAPDTTWRGHVLPGGWEIDIPDIDVDRAAPRFRAIVKRYMRMGKRPFDAEEAAAASIRDFFAREWRARTMKLVGRWASLYVQQAGSLAGFDATLVASTWIPGNVFLTPGSAEVKVMFAEMKRNAEATTHGNV